MKSVKMEVRSSASKNNSSSDLAARQGIGQGLSGANYGGAIKKWGSGLRVWAVRVSNDVNGGYIPSKNDKGFLSLAILCKKFAQWLDDCWSRCPLEVFFLSIS